ncbi:hypothetical protein [Heyndrickxia coagulans]|uniref:hypothetical protein n=1 Tax=Heyndrickxia coagulans TaxID=1398 RepID=UPI001F421993|nr:hypothetical protein [Heyndrickxia coagulans]
MLKDFKRSINYVESVREVLEKEANEILKLKDRINFRMSLCQNKNIPLSEALEN